jgi:hypothetical protein
METTELVPYNLEQATIENLKSKYLDVTIKPDDKSAYAMVMAGLRECREIRLAVDAWHKEKKEGIVKAGKHFDAERRRVHGLVEPIEMHLATVRKAEDDRKEEIRTRAEREERERLETLHRLEAERLEKIRQEQEAEQKRLDEIRKAEEEKARKVREDLEAERRQIEAEKKALEDAKRKEIERQERAEFERKAQEQAKAKAEAEAKAKVEREAKDKAEREEKERAEKARQESLKPDKQKLYDWANVLLEIEGPELQNEDARLIRLNALTGIGKIAKSIIKQAKEM